MYTKLNIYLGINRAFKLDPCIRIAVCNGRMEYAKYGEATNHRATDVAATKSSVSAVLEGIKTCRSRRC